MACEQFYSYTYTCKYCIYNIIYLVPTHIHAILNCILFIYMNSFVGGRPQFKSSSHWTKNSLPRHTSVVKKLDRKSLISPVRNMVVDTKGTDQLIAYTISPKYRLFEMSQFIKLCSFIRNYRRKLCTSPIKLFRLHTYGRSVWSGVADNHHPSASLVYLEGTSCDTRKASCTVLNLNFYFENANLLRSNLKFLSMKITSQLY